MRNIMITGASGMLASALLKRLTENKSTTVFAVSSKEIAETAENMHYIPLGQEEKCFRENTIDCVIHCAFPRNAQPDMWADGIEYSFRLMFSAKKYGAKSIINISSQSLYGWDRTKPASEEAPVSLSSPYTTGKFCTELLTEQLFSNIPHTNIRLATLIGKDSHERVPNRLIQDLIARRDLIIRGGDQIFSFLDVEDAADALCHLAESPAENRRTRYNIGTEEYHTLSEIAQMCIEAGKAFGISGSTVIHEPADIKLDNRLSCEAFSRDLGWQARRSLRASINEIFDAAMEKSL